MNNKLMHKAFLLAYRFKYLIFIGVFMVFGSIFYFGQGPDFLEVKHAQAAVQFRAASAHVVNATVTTLTISKPSGTVDGDIMIAQINQKGNQVITAPAGWNLIHTINNGTINQATAFWKRASSEGSSYAFTKPTDDNLLWHGAIVSFSGAISSGSPLDTGTGAQTERANAASNTITATGIDPTASDIMVIFMAFRGDDYTTMPVAGGTTPTYTLAYGSPNGYETTSGTDGSINMSYGISDGTATGNDTVVATGTAALNEAILLGLLPEPPPAITISGTCDAYDQTTDCTDIGEIKVAVNGVLNTTNTQATVAGTWSITNFPKPATNAIITVFIDGVAGNGDKAVAVTKYTGTGDITGVKLMKEHITIGSNQNTTVTNADMGQYDNSNDTDIIFEGQKSSTCDSVSIHQGPGLCTDNGGYSTQERLYIDAGDTFAPGSGTVVTKMQVEGTFNSANALVVTGSGTNATCGSSTQIPICSNGSFTNTDTGFGTVFRSGSATSIQALSYGDLVFWSNTTFTPLAGTFNLRVIYVTSGTPTVNFSTNNPTVNLTSFAGFTGATSVSAGSGTWTFSGDINFSPLTMGGTFNANTSTFVFNTINASGNVSLPAITFYNMTVAGADTYDLGGSTTVQNNFTIGSSATLSAGSNTLTVGGNFDVDGSFDAGTGTVTFNDSGKTSAVTGSSGGGPVVADSYSESNKSGDIAIYDSGASVYQYSQSFTGNGATLSTVEFYLHRSGLPIYDLYAEIYAHSGTYGTSSVPTGSPLATSDTFSGVLTPFYALKTFTFSGGNQISLDSGTNYVLVLTAVGGDGADFVEFGYDSTSPSHSGNMAYNDLGLGWTPDNSGDMVFYVYTTSTSPLTFNNLTVTTPNKTVQFETTKTFQVNGALTVTGSSGNLVNFTSTDTSNPTTTNWIINHQGTESITYLSVNHSSCDPLSTTITLGTGSTKDGNSGSCWTVPFTGVTIGGTAYSGQGTGALTSKTVVIKVNGADACSGLCTGETNGSGVYSIANVAANVGDVMTIFLDDETENAVQVRVSAGTNISTLDLYQNTLIVSYGTGSSITNTHLDNYDDTNGGSDGDVPFAVTSGALTLNDGIKLLVWTGMTYAPGGAVTTSPSADGTDSVLDGDIDIQASATLNMGTNALSVGGDFDNSGTLTVSATQTTTFTATATGHAINYFTGSFYNLIFNGSGGGWNFTDASNTITGDLTVTAGTLSGSVDITVNDGSTTGDGVINLTGGTFTIIGTGNFGGSSAWTFNNLTFGVGSSGTSTSTGSGSIFVNGVMTISANQTLEAGSKTWIFAPGTPIVRNGTFTAQTSTARFWGDGTFNLPAATMTGANAFYYVSINGISGANNVVAQSAIEVKDQLWLLNISTLTMGSNNLTIGNAGSSSETLIGATGTGTINQNSSATTTFLGPNASSRCIGGITTSCTSHNPSGNFSFGNVVIGDGSNGFTLTHVATNLNITTNDMTIASGSTFTTVDSVGSTGNVTGNGILNFTGGTFTHSTTSSKNFGGNSAWAFNNLFLQGAGGTTAATGSGSVTVGGILTNSASHTLSAGDKTWILSASGTPFSQSGSVSQSSGTSTFSYRGTTSTTIPNAGYDNIDFSPATGTPTYTLASGTHNVSGNFTLGGAGNVTVTANINSATLDIGGTVTIGASDTLSSNQYIYVGGSWANSGTFTNNDSTVQFDSTTTGNTITSGGSGFYEIFFDGVGGGWTLQNTLNVGKALSISNGDLNASSRTINLSGSAQPFSKFGGTFTQGTSTVNYIDAQPTNILDLNGSGSTDAYYNLGLATAVDSTSETYYLIGSTTVNNQVTVSNASSTGTDTFNLGSYTLTLKGATTPLNIISGKGALSAGTSTVVYASTTGVSALSSAAMTSGNAFYNLTIDGDGGGDTFTAGVDIAATNDFTVTTGDIFASANNVTVNGVVGGDGTIGHTANTFTHNATTSKNFGGATAWTFANLTLQGASGTTAANGAGSITVTGVLTNNTSHTLNAGSKTWTLSGTGTPFSNSGTFTANASTVNYTGAGATTIAAGTLFYWNLGILPGANSAVHTTASGTLSVSNAVTFGNGTNTSVSVNLNTNSTNLNVGAVTIAANTLLVASASGTAYVAGNWLNQGIFSHSNGTITFWPSVSQNITSGGSSFYNVQSFGDGITRTLLDTFTIINDLTITGGTITGAVDVTVGGGDLGSGGILNMTGGTFTINGTGNLSNSSNTYTFNNLTIGGNITATNAAAVTVNGVLTIGGGGTFNAGAKTYNLTGSGTPLVRTGTFNADTSTMLYSSSSGATLANAPVTYYSLQISGAGTFNAGAQHVASNQLAVMTGNLALGANNITVGSTSVVNSGLIWSGSGTALTQDSGATTTVLSSAGASVGFAHFGGSRTFGNLVIGNGSTAFTYAGSGTTSVTTLTVTANTTFNSGNLNITGNGTPLVSNGTFTAQSLSNINFDSTGTTGTTIPALTYYNLGMNKSGNTFTAAGAITVNNNLTISNGTFVAPSGNLTIVNDFTNNGTFTHNNGTVVIAPATNDTVTIGGSSNTTFNNLTNTVPKTIMQFANGRTYSIDGTWTVTGSKGRPIWIQSDSAGVQWLVDINGSTAISYANVKDSGCSSSLNISTTNRVYNQGNNGVCWIFILQGGSAINAPSGGGAGGSGGTSGGGQGGGSGGSQGGSGGSGGVGGGSSTSQLYPGTITNDASAGTLAWTNLTGANNANYDGPSVIVLVGGQLGATNNLKLTNFGFNIPNEATINGITVNVYRRGFYTVSTDVIAKLIVNNVISGTNKADTSTDWEQVFTSKTYGGASDLWGLTLTPSIVNASNFGFAVSSNITAGDTENDGRVLLDYAQITVHYSTTPSQGGGGSGGSP